MKLKLIMIISLMQPLNASLDELIQAIKQGDKAAVARLFTKDIRDDSLDQQGNSLIDIAVRSNQEDIARFLLSKGAIVTGEQLEELNASEPNELPIMFTLLGISFVIMVWLSSLE